MNIRSCERPVQKQSCGRTKKTFITERDFIWMRKRGIKIVRIPVGYWILHGDGPYVSSIGRLDWAFAMCQKYNIYLLLDIHGLPGSQNGRDHSGKQGKRGWRKNPDTIEQGLRATITLAKRYADQPALWGVQIINEPFPGLFNVALRRYYRQAYDWLSLVLPPHVRVVYSDAFTPRLMSTALYSAVSHPAVMDIHWYHFGGPWLFARPRLWLVATRWHGRLLKRLGRWNGVIVGEWSGCYAQRIFDKYPVATHHAMVSGSVQAQMDAYGAAEAWFYWSYKTEQPGVWNFKSLVDDGTVTLGQQ